MKLLVTGGAGFIGSNFINSIANNEFAGIDEVVILDNLTYAGVLENIEPVFSRRGFNFIQGDICDLNLVSELIAEVDCVINFAAESHVDRSIGSASEFIKSNIGGVQILLDAIRISKKHLRFVQISTDEVYGSIEFGSWSEESPVQPNSPYSASKAGGELLASAYHRTHGLDVVITRCSNNYGSHHFPEKLIPLFITNLLEGRKVPIYGNGKNVRDWLHVKDHCRGIYKVLMNGRSGEVYNIGGGREMTNLEITELVLASMGMDDSSIEYVKDRKGHDFRYSVNWSKINKELGYEPTIKFEDGLRDTIQWYRENENWWKPLKKRVRLNK